MGGEYGHARPAGYHVRLTFACPASSATSNRHDRSLLLDKWPAAEALLCDSGLCRKQPCKIEAITRCADTHEPDAPQGSGNGEEVCREL